MTWVFWAGVLCLIIYEVVSIFRAAPGATISEMVWQVSTCRPIVPFIAGLLAGHLFWQKTP